MHPDLEKILITEQELQKRVREIGQQISADYAGKEILVVGILKGAAVFLADLVRYVSGSVYFDFMAVSSYGAGSASSGVVRILKDLDRPIEGRHVIIVEDIVDTGLTLNYLVQSLQSRNPASLKVCTLLDKPERRVASVKVDYNGFAIPDQFVVGYGLDYNERYRNFPYIGVLKRSVYA